MYIGHTTNFSNRKNSHKICCNDINNKNYNRYVYQFIRDNGGWDNWCMIQIEERNCKDKREAESVEHECIKKLSATLNTNKPYAMCKENPKLYKQDWYEENKEQILQKAKENYEENKEQKLEYQKQYAEENKEQIKGYQEEYREKNKEKLSEQKKEYRAAHKEEAAETQKKWKEANKEKIKEQRAQIINCECGCQYTFGNKHRHLKSNIHTTYINSISVK
jgi:vacuolar-type H+-ATPase subunit I/STV1